MKILSIVSVAVLLFLLNIILSTSKLSGQQARNEKIIPSNKPVFEVDYSNPTADKPQSKIWYMEGSWWALLPRQSGASLWERTPNGWVEDKVTNALLAEIPGKVDVYAQNGCITAVGVGETSLTVFRLTQEKKDPKLTWKVQVLTELSSPTSDIAIETATITKDESESWWVAATVDRKVFVWGSTSDGKDWSDPIILADGVSNDDISLVTRIPEGVAVIWSDQVNDKVAMRKHIDGRPWKVWESEEIIKEGNNTADDHLNAALSPNGTLWLATKNSVDKVGRPQFVLRVRDKDGNWVNYPYENLGNGKHPSRPIVIATENNSVVFVGHDLQDRLSTYANKVIFAMVDTTISSILKNPQVVIAPENKAFKRFKQNVTGPKNIFPVDAPWIILASDKEGGVYEADLRGLIQPLMSQNVTNTTVSPRVITDITKWDTEDPAIWINKSNPEKSLIIGTDKNTDGALYAFDLKGKIVKVKRVLARPNNVDIAYGFSYKTEKIDIAVVTER